METSSVVSSSSTQNLGANTKPSRRKYALLVCGVAAVACADIVASIALSNMGLRVPCVFAVVRWALLVVGFVLAVKCGAGVWRCGNDQDSRRPRRSGDVEMPLASNDRLGGTDLSERRAATEDLSRHKWKAKLTLAVLFIMVTANSVYSGILIIADTEYTTTVAVYLCISIFCMNFEFLLAKLAVDKTIVEEGLFLPAVHEHPLHYSSKKSLVFCSVCRERVGPKTGGYETFTCKECEGGGKGGGKGGFNLCILCYQKQMVKGDVSEGILRSDKGPKPMTDLSPGQYMKRALRLAAPFKFNFVAAILCVLVTQGSQVLLPNYQGKLINSLVAQDQDEFKFLLTRFIFFSVICALFNSLKSLSVQYVSKQITIGVRMSVFKSCVCQDIAFFDGIMTGQLTSRMTQDAQSVTTPIQQVMNTILANLITLVGGFFMCFYTSWKLTMLALTMVGPVIYLTGSYARWSKDINMQVRASMGDANATATESLRNIRTVRAMGADQVEMAAVEGHFQQAWHYMKRDCLASAGVGAITGYVNFSASVLVFWYGGYAVLHKTDSQLSIGSLTTFNLYWVMLRNSINSLNGMLNQLIVAASAAKRVFEIIDLEPDIKLTDPQALALDQVVPRNCAPSIEFRNVHFTYQMRPDEKVFKGVSFIIPAGTTAALVGRSGCGKSTTTSLLMRFYDPEEGSILIEGRPLPEYDLRSFQRRIGIVSQETQIFARSVRENLIYGMSPEDYTDEAIEIAARQANAHEFIMSMMGGYESMLGENGSRLSGGQKQRLSIARALLRRPQLLLLDEATSALDADNEKQIQKALDDMVEAIAGSCSIIIIAHRLSTVMGADKIIVIDEGRVHEEGTHGQLMKNGLIYASLVQKQLAHAGASEERAEEQQPEQEEWRRGKGKGKGKTARRNASGKGKGTGLAEEEGS